MNTSRSPTIAGDAYPLPFWNSQTSGGGSVRLSFVSVDTPLCVGPRNEAQSLVTAPSGNGFGSRYARVWPNAARTVNACAASARSIARRDSSDIDTSLLRSIGEHETSAERRHQDAEKEDR